MALSLRKKTGGRQAPASRTKRATQAANGVFPDRRSNRTRRPYKTFVDRTRPFYLLLDNRRCHIDTLGHPPIDVPATRAWLRPLHPRCVDLSSRSGGLPVLAPLRLPVHTNTDTEAIPHILDTHSEFWTVWSLQPVTTTRGRRSAAPRLRSRPLLHRPTTIKTCRPTPPWLMWLSLLPLNRRL